MNSRPRKQHLISRVLLRRFTSTAHAGQLRAFDLRHGRPRMRHPAGVAWREGFVEHDVAETEELWWRVEDRLDAALDAVEAGTVFETAGAAETLRQAVALHFMRRELVKDSFDRSLARARGNIRVPEGFRGPPEVFVKEIAARLDDLRPAAFAEHLRSLYERARSLATSSRLEVFESPYVPLLIGDSAVLSMRRDGGVGFIPFSDAATHVLPVGRRHLVALAPADALHELPAKWARDLNERQVLNARRHVFFSPEDDLETFVREIREQHASGA